MSKQPGYDLQVAADDWGKEAIPARLPAGVSGHAGVFRQATFDAFIAGAQWARERDAINGVVRHPPASPSLWARFRDWWAMVRDFPPQLPF